MGRAQINALQEVRQQSIPQSEEGLRSYYEALLRASVQGLAHTDVESGPSNTSSGSVLRDVHTYSEGAAFLAPRAHLQWQGQNLRYQSEPL
jgi:hypothetical protein